MDSRIGEVLVLSLEICDPSIHWTLGYQTVTESGYAFCISPARGVRGTILLQLDWTVRVWIIGEESSGTRVL